MATYTFGLNTNRSHLIVTTPSHSYAVPYVDLAIQTPQMPSGQEQVIVSNNGQAVVAVPFSASNLVGATWQDKLNDLVQNYLYMGFGSGGGTLTGVIAGAGLSTDGAVPQPTLTNASEGFYMDGRSFLVSATHPNTDVNTHVFSTIQAAFTALETLAGTGHFSIYVSPGDYNEGPTLTVNQYELSLIALGTVTLTGDLTMDCQGAGSVTVTSEGGMFYGTSFFHSGNTTNQPLTRLEHVHMSNKIIDSSGAGGAFFYLEDCAIPHFHCFFLEEALNTSFCTLSDFVVDTRVNRISDCTFGSQPITINGWQNASSGLRNCQFQGGASVFNGPDQLQLDNASYYSFLEQGWTCATSFLWIDRLPPSGVTAGSYTSTNLTVDAQGRITAASNGGGGVTSVGAFSNTGTANGASIAGTVITMRAGSPSTPGMGKVMTHVAGICAVGDNCFPQVNAGSVGTNITAVGPSAYGTASLVTNSANNNTSIGAHTMSQVSTANETTCVGYYAGNALTIGGYGTYVGSQSGRQITTTAYNAALGYQTLYTGAGASNCTALGTFSGNVTTGADNTHVGYRAGVVVGAGARNCSFGSNANSNGTTGSDNICLGYSTTLAAVGNSTSLVIGNSTAGNGSNTTTIGASYVRAVAGGNALSQNSGTGEVTRAVSSLRYKDVIDPTPPVAQFTRYLFKLEPRGVTMKNDPEKTPRITYVAEEVEKITGPKGNPVFAPLLVYADLPDPELPPTTITETYKVFNEETQAFEDHERQVEVPTKRRMVDGINYAGFVVPLVELCKQQQQQIDALIARLDAAGIP